MKRRRLRRSEGVSPIPVPQECRSSAVPARSTPSPAGGGGSAAFAGTVEALGGCGIPGPSDSKAEAGEERRRQIRPRVGCVVITPPHPPQRIRATPHRSRGWRRQSPELSLRFFRLPQPGGVACPCVSDKSVPGRRIPSDDGSLLRGEAQRTVHFREEAFRKSVRRPREEASRYR